MGQRQFRSDDTEKWRYGFGKGAYDAVISSNETHTWNGSTRFQAQGAITGTAGQTSFVKPAGWGHTGFCLLYQTQTTGAGIWELAWVDFTGASAVADKPLQNSYTTGAQIITLSNGWIGYKNFTVNAGVTLSAPAWDGSTGGCVVVFAKETITVNGAISAIGSGFRGGVSKEYWGWTGESYAGAQQNYGNQNAYGSGGGGGAGNNHPTDVKPHAGGGGGGHATSGATGSTGAGYAAGVGGGTAGNAGLTVMVFGGGGGGSATPNANGWWSAAGYMNGKAGGGIIVLIAKNIVINGNLYANGLNSDALVDGRMGYGGAGAGGSILMKAMTATLGTNKITATGGGVGAAGGAGRIHIDYATSYSGSTNPGIDARQDLTIKPFGGNQFFLLM